MTPMPWFRFYSEAVRDTKLRRIARKTDRPFAETVGTWAIILSFASESPKRGTVAVTSSLSRCTRSFTRSPFTVVDSFISLPF